MKRLAAAWMVSGGAWLWATGCSSKPAEARAVPAESFAAEFSQAVCANVGRCCSRSEFHFARTSCEARLKASFQTRLDQLLVDLDYDEVVAGTCLARLGEPQSCTLSLGQFPQCQGMLVGQLENGQLCDSDSSCKSRWCARLADAPFSFVCSPPQGSPLGAGKAADACAGTCDSPRNCPLVGGGVTPTVCYRTDGLFCAASGGIEAQRCQGLRGAGEPCEVDEECEVGSFCEGVCEAPRPNGAYCGNANECQSGACLDGECVDSAFSEESCASGGTSI
jgi:hypothetical protein